MEEEKDLHWMQYALKLADKAAELGEVPVGAVIVRDNEVIGEGWNQPISTHDPTAHAEIMAIRAAAVSIGNYRLVGADLYVTLEPCSMCAGAIVHSRISRVVYGATEPKAGAIQSRQNFLENDWLNYRVEFKSGVMADECGEKISQFFRNRREQKRQLKVAEKLNPAD